MRIFLDCEFNGFGGELISLAMVAEDGREWYALCPEPRVWDAWVFENVFPVLQACGRRQPMTRDEFRQSLLDFLSLFDNPTIVVDWYTDLVHFFSLFAGKDHTKSVGYACRAEVVLDPPGFAPEVPHNALSDARAIRTAYMSAIHAEEDNNGEARSSIIGGGK